jgi:hypothetical protein
MGIYVVRAFVRLKQASASYAELAKRLAELEDKTEALAMSHDTFSHNTRNQLKQVFDALRELMTPPEPIKRPIGFVTPEGTRARRLRGQKARHEPGALQAKGKAWYRSPTEKGKRQDLTPWFV